MLELFTFNAALLLLGVFSLYLLGLGIYRLYLDPIAKFPGPKLAALTLWYQFYYDVLKQGKYTSEIEKMHEAYGWYHVLSEILKLGNRKLRPYCSN